MVATTRLQVTIFFLMQNLCYLESGRFILTKKELKEVDLDAPAQETEEPAAPIAE